MLRHLDLFSGIGGFALAARMVGGYETVGFCEIEPYCQAVLRKHWPGVPIHDDVRSFPGVACDVLTGGFPCQDISLAGKGTGLAGERSGLWSEFHRIIGECRPRWVVIENSPALRVRGYDRIESDLAGIGYAGRPFVVSAADIGADHLRRRTWIVANAFGVEFREQPRRSGRPDGADSVFARTDGEARTAADAYGAGLSQRLMRRGIPGEAQRPDHGENSPMDSWWKTRPNLVRGVHGVSGRVDRIRALGNSIVPQVAAIFLEAIKRCHDPENAVTLKTA